MIKYFVNVVLLLYLAKLSHTFYWFIIAIGQYNLPKFLTFCWKLQPAFWFNLFYNFGNKIGGIRFFFLLSVGGSHTNCFSLGKNLLLVISLSQVMLLIWMNYSYSQGLEYWEFEIEFYSCQDDLLESWRDNSFWITSQDHW